MFPTDLTLTSGCGQEILVHYNIVGVIMTYANLHYSLAIISLLRMSIYIDVDVTFTLRVYTVF